MNNQNNQSNQSNQNNISIENLKVEIEGIKADIEKLQNYLKNRIELYQLLKLKELRKRFKQITDIETLKELQKEIQELLGKQGTSNSKKEVPKEKFLNYLNSLKQKGIKTVEKTKLYEDFSEYSIRNKLYSFHDFYPDKPSQKDTKIYDINEFIKALNSSKKKTVILV